MSEQAGDGVFRKRFDLAKARCLAGHGAGCSYGGLTPGSGHWFLVDARCVFSHGEACEVCGGAGYAVLCGWRDGTPRAHRGTAGGLIWGVTLCAACSIMYPAAPQLQVPAALGVGWELPAHAHA